MGKTIERLGLQNKVRQMFLSGMPLSTIATDISASCGEEISRKEVQGFIKRESKNLLKMEKAQENYSEKVLDTYRNICGQAKELNSVVWETIYNLKKTPETSVKQIICEKCHHKNNVTINNYNQLIKSCDHILAQITLSNKILKNLGSSKGIQINISDFSKKIAIGLPALLTEFEKKGLIKIMKKRLRQHFKNQNLEFSEEEEEESEEGMKDGKSYN